MCKGLNSKKACTHLSFFSEYMRNRTSALSWMAEVKSTVRSQNWATCRTQWNTAASLLLSDGLRDSNQHIRGLKCSREKGTISSTTSITHPLPRQAGALALHSIYADRVHMFAVRVIFFTWPWFSNAPRSARCRWGQLNCQLQNAKRSDACVAVMNSK